MSPFDVVKCLTEKSEADKDEVRDAYSPWIINKAMSFIQDCVPFANEVNKMRGIDKSLQFDFYYHGIPKRKRFYKWVKKPQFEEDIDLLSSLFGINKNTAVKYAELMTEDQLKELRETMNTGGRK